jgi:hypothetical protein
MRAVFLYLLIVLFAYSTVWAEVTPDDAKTEEAIKANVMDFRNWLMKELAQFPKGEVHPGKNYASVPRKKKFFTASEYNRAAKSNWVKCQILQGLSTLSQQLANTAGTAFASQSAGQLQQYSTQLQQSDDPQFQQVGSLYSQEAQALQTGNVQGADQAASQVAAVPTPYVAPGYQVSQSESTSMQNFNQVVGSIILGLAGILGTMAVGQLLPALGLTSTGALLNNGQTAPVTTAISSSSSLTNLSTGSVLGNSTLGSSSLQQLGNINVKQLQSQGSSNAAGAPSAQ